MKCPIQHGSNGLKAQVQRCDVTDWATTSGPFSVWSAQYELSIWTLINAVRWFCTTWYFHFKTAQIYLEVPNTIKPCNAYINTFISQDNERDYLAVMCTKHIRAPSTDARLSNCFTSATFSFETTFLVKSLFRNSITSLQKINKIFHNT